jgi:hypothetical protein
VLIASAIARTCWNTLRSKARTSDELPGVDMGVVFPVEPAGKSRHPWRLAVTLPALKRRTPRHDNKLTMGLTFALT